MPYVGQTIPGAFDTQASSPDRHRRNWQILTNLLAAGNLFTVAANGGLTNGVTGLAVQVNSTGGLSVGAGGLAVKLDPAGALSSSSAGLAVKVDGSTINIVGDKLVGSAGAGVTSVALAAPSAFLTVSGSPVTTTGTLTLAFPATPTLPQGTSVTFTNSQTTGTNAGFSINSSWGAFSGALDADLLLARTEPGGGSGFSQYFIYATNNGVQEFSVDHIGRGVLNGGLTIGGSLSIGSGGISLSSGSFYTHTGSLSASQVNCSNGFTKPYFIADGFTLLDSNGSYVNSNSNVGAVVVDYNGHFIGTSTPLSIAAGAGAGGTPTVAVSGNDPGGLISVTTGTLPSSSAVVATISFQSAYFSTPKSVVLFPANAVTAALGAVSVYISTLTTAHFVISSGSVALAAATAYRWYFIVMG